VDWLSIAFNSEHEVIRWLAEVIDERTVNLRMRVEANVSIAGEASFHDSCATCLPKSPTRLETGADRFQSRGLGRGKSSVEWGTGLA
jgi:hypothetical protein